MSPPRVVREEEEEVSVDGHERRQGSQNGPEQPGIGRSLFVMLQPAKGGDDLRQHPVGTELGDRGHGAVSPVRVAADQAPT